MAAGLQQLHNMSGSKAFAFKSGVKSQKLRLARPPVHRRTVTVTATYEVGVGLFGTKAGMMSWFTKDGICLPATVIALESDNYVTQVKTDATNGYSAVQVGYKIVPEKKVTRPELGHLAKSQCPPLKHLREFKLKDQKLVESYQPGQMLKPDEMFKEGDLVDVAGKSIGKGFQGGVKRWNHKRGNMTHGSKSHREHGSSGPATGVSRVWPGGRFAGQMGDVRKKIRKLQVLKVDTERGAIIVKGCVPGKSGNIVQVTAAKIVGKNFKAGVHY